MNGTLTRTSSNGTAPVITESRVSPLMERLIVCPEDPHAELLTISPADARVIIEHRNPRNRTLGRKRRDYLAETLKAGLWKVNGETVIFGSDGNLLDGQGRLAACALSGVPLETWAVFGIDPSTFHSIDRGKKRSLSDDLSIEGEKNTSQLAAALTLLWLEAEGKLQHAGQVKTCPTPIAEGLLAEHPEIRRSVQVARAAQKVIIGSVGAYCHFRFARKDRDEADIFFEDLKTGASLPLLDPVLALRNRLLNARSDREKIPTRDLIGMVVKAWNARREGKEIKRFVYLASEGVPEPA